MKPHTTSDENPNHHSVQRSLDVASQVNRLLIDLQTNRSIRRPTETPVRLKSVERRCIEFESIANQMICSRQGTNTSVRLTTVERRTGWRSIYDPLSTHAILGLWNLNTTEAIYPLEPRRTPYRRLFEFQTIANRFLVD